MATVGRLVAAVRPAVAACARSQQITVAAAAAMTVTRSLHSSPPTRFPLTKDDEKKLEELWRVLNLNDEKYMGKMRPNDGKKRPMPLSPLEVKNLLFETDRNFNIPEPHGVPAIAKQAADGKLHRKLLGVGVPQSSQDWGQRDEMDQSNEGIEEDGMEGFGIGEMGGEEGGEEEVVGLKPAELVRHSLVREKLEAAGLFSRVIQIRRVSQQTGNGKIPSFTALVAVGNGNGYAGYATAGSSSPATAMDIATNRAMHRMVFIPRYNNHTIYHRLHVKERQTRIYLRPRSAGAGLIVHSTLQNLCDVCGIKDISGNVIGSVNRLNLVRAFFQAVTSQRSVEDVAKARGKNILNLKMAVNVYG
eukprot:comp20791_c0_seq1/m.27324 comp20791_c0_seq1/g.27324  ORF comp20791_c0_seq1/g.27324 comp20791_c0_seq1/m.27324 type:complete len:360 (-) comp20791_c0_seq1:412-1491(-)